MVGGARHGYWTLVPILVLLFAQILGGDEDESEPKKKLTADQKQTILSLFSATEASFDENDRLSLMYKFSWKTESLVDDWLPPLEKSKGRIRWSRGLEGTPAHVLHGLMISDRGSFFHKALWRELRMEVIYQSTSGMRPGDLVSAAFTFKKGKRTVGSNLGSQCVRISRGRIAGRPVPAKAPVIPTEKAHRFGFQLKDGVFAAQTNGSTLVDTREHPQFLKGLTPGRAGLVWRGSIQGFVFKITLEGELDPEWVSKQ